MILAVLLFFLAITVGNFLLIDCVIHIRGDSITQKLASRIACRKTIPKPKTPAR